MRAEVVDCFKAIDTECQGFITIREIAAMLKSLGKNVIDLPIK